MADYYRISDKDYQKAVGQLRLALGVVLGTFSMYGQGAYIPGAQQEIIWLAEDFSLRCRGVDKPISVEYMRRRARKKSGTKEEGRGT